MAMGQVRSTRNSRRIGTISAVLAVALPGVALLVGASPAHATSGDVFARGVGYCASTYSGHPTLAGFGPAVDLNIGFGDDSGTPLYAPENGSVVVHSTGYGNGWGNSIIWKSASGAERLHLAHLRGDSPLFNRNVTAGQLIGYLGSTGNSSGPHLHIARSVNGSGAALVLSGRSINPPAGTPTNCTSGPHYFVSNGPVAAAPPPAPQVSIKSTANGRFVSAELSYTGGSYGMLRARAGAVNAWERFRLVGDCRSSSGCAIQSAANGRYVSAELNYGGGSYGMLRARAGAINAWERFRIE